MISTSPRSAPRTQPDPSCGPSSTGSSALSITSSHPGRSRSSISHTRSATSLRSATGWAHRRAQSASPTPRSRATPAKSRERRSSSAAQTHQARRWRPPRRTTPITLCAMVDLPIPAAPTRTCGRPGQCCGSRPQESRRMSSSRPRTVDDNPASPGTWDSVPPSAIANAGPIRSLAGIAEACAAAVAGWDSPAPRTRSAASHSAVKRAASSSGSRRGLCHAASWRTTHSTFSHPGRPAPRSRAPTFSWLIVSRYSPLVIPAAIRRRPGFPAPSYRPCSASSRTRCGPGGRRSSPGSAIPVATAPPVHPKVSIIVNATIRGAVEGGNATSIPVALLSANARGLSAGANLELRPERQSKVARQFCRLTQEAIVSMSAPDPVNAYLLVCPAGAALMPLIVVAIACPAAWSRDARHRTDARGR